MIHDSEKPDGEPVVIDVRGEHADEIAERLREMGGTFREYGKPNTVFRVSEGSPPILYYSPERPTRRLRFLCWLIGARVDYLPDRVSFSWTNRNTLPVIDPRIDPKE